MSHDAIVSAFARQGVQVDDGVEALLARMYPLSGGTYSAFSRRVMLVRVGDQTQVWTTWTGPTPKRLLRTRDVTTVRVVDSRRRFVRAYVGGQRLWVRRGDVARLLSWRGD